MPLGPDGTTNTDWVLEVSMVVLTHLLYPGGKHERYVTAIGADGGP